MEISTFLEHQEKDTQNVKRVKAFYRAAKEKDSETITKLLVDDPVWSVSPGFPDGGIYRGLAEIFHSFYPSLLSRFYYFDAFPDVYIDGGDVVTVLGYYKFIKKEGESSKLVRFSHTWGIDNDGRIKGVWQVADSAQLITSNKTDATDAQSRAAD
ncbi:hypothetical protein SAMN05660649_01301 [Desulfotomaculum arcticum]|uniref:SnoaL-like domain-containing protein n=2 Tax=Desulfotruncus TaxID=2867377 RepID=A0A1I2QPW0_9FIRM|nr:hypothetical protein SAMN05660649_01301 [Desulfotomaculum arcticum] [Desulfotruncus arcticus DSM 17038]